MTTAAPLTSAVEVLTKPRLRGFFHLWSFIVSLATGSTLIAVAGATVSGAAAAVTAVYSATVSGLFGTSALYHRRMWASSRAAYRIKRLDHAMIFVFIAGSYTPFATFAMPESTGTTVLVVVWVGAAAGVARTLLWPGAPRWVAVPIYLALGWLAVFVFPELLAHGGVGALVLLIVGGALYTVGALVYGLRWPDPWPNTFGFHEVFHTTTVLAAICHFIAVWLTMYSPYYAG